MRRKKRYGVGILLSAMLLLWSPGDVACAEGRDVMQQNLVRMQTGEQKQQGEISAETVSRMDADRVTVTTPEGFMDALRQRKSQIVVDGSIVIDNGAEASGRMRPVMIPGGTVISGTTGSSINSRSPIQIEGDVTIRDIRLVFSSSNALGSVPHREIFLAGYGLTLENVSTYLEGGDSSLGGLGGTEKELLPTIYAGGYPGTAVGTQASLTLQNSNSQTMFQGIYLGHGAGNDQKVPYSGAAVFNMDCSVIVRDGVYARENDAAGINVNGNGYAKTKAFYGNSNTTLTIREASVETAVVEQVGRIVLDDNATLAPQTVPKKEHRFQTQVKKAKPGADGSTASQCRECGMVSGRSVISQPKTIKLSADSYTYNGKQRKPSVKVTDKNGKVINSRNYTVSYGNHKNVGRAVVTVRFKGNYEGTLKKTFTIVPKTTDLKLTPKKKSFTVKWKKQGTQTDGYVIEYSTSSRFTKKTTSSVKVANKNTTSKTVKKVRGNKKYYVRICTYKVVRVNGKKITLRSEWSKVRTVKPGK